jgi:hypothetical protein
VTDDPFLRGSGRRLRSRSDRRASRRVGLAAGLLRLDFDIALTAFLTGVPVSLVDLIQSELHPTPVGVDATPRRRRRRIVGTAVLDRGTDLTSMRIYTVTSLVDAYRTTQPGNAASLSKRGARPA